MTGPINPIQNVQRTISSHKENVVPSQVLHFTVPLQDDQLGKNGDGLEVDGESPQEINDVVDFVRLDEVGNTGNNDARKDSKFPMEERVLGSIVGGCDWFPETNGVDHGRGGDDVEYFHAGVVERVKLGEEI